MDHPLTALDTAVRPWRTATLVACAVAAVELILLIVLGGTLLARHGSSAGTVHRAAPAKPAAVHARTVVPGKHATLTLTRREVGVLVLNGNGRHGAASTAAARVRGHGYRIRGVGNAHRMDYTRSIVMYRPGFEVEGRRLARDLGVGIVGPLDGLRTAQLHGAKAVLVVGA